jgi:uncharacterized protein
MRALDPRAPGIYQTFDAVAPPPLQIANTRIPGFVGITQRGPLDEPTRLTNWDEFVEIFGYTADSYLSDSVHGFFQNGGSDCWVVRIANVPTAARAQHVALDAFGKPAFAIRALDEGTWGNALWFKCVHAPGASSLLTRDLDIGAGEASIASTRGFEVGSLVKIHDREGADYVVITEVGDKLVKWATETPVNRKHRAAAPTHLDVMTFEIHVAMRDRREVFKGLQMHAASKSYAPRVIAQRSRLVRVEDLASRSPVPHNLPEPVAMTRLAGGQDGVDALTPEDFLGHDLGPGARTGLAALAANEEVAILCIPDAMRFYDREPGPAGELKAQRLQDTMISICENQRDRFAILDIPQSKDIEWVRRWRRRTDSSYAAYYWPWLKVTTWDEQAHVVPPSAFLAGCYARRDRDGVHHAPANLEIVGAQDVALRVTEDHIGMLNSDAVNTFRLQRGVRPWGARTASSDPEWRYVSVRRLFIMLRRSLEAGFAWITFEPNNDRTWGVVRDRVTAFLADLHTKGMLAGGNPEQAYFVKCDAETNPPDQVDSGMLICDVGVAPVAPAEFIMISLVQTMTGPATPT